MSFRKILTLVLSLMAVMVLSGAAAHAEDGTYVFILIARGNSYWTALADGIHDEAKAKGIKEVTYNTESSTDAEQQLNICQTAIQSQPKAIVMAAINPSVAIQCFKMAAKQGITIADVDGSFSVADAKKAGLKLAFSVGSDNYIIGQKGAEYIAKIVDKPDPKVFVLEGTVGSVQAGKRADGFRDRLKELMPQADIVASISAEFDRLQAMNIALDVLQRHPDLDIIYAANDTMALGAAEAARNLGLDKQIKIIGVDGTADARKAIREGRLTASVAQLPYLMGMRSVELAMDSVATHKTGLSEITATPVLTKDMIEANKDPSLQYVR
jgi:D-allose transport system substrate-binding protein